MIDITKQYQTRDGRKVRLISDKGEGQYPIVGYIADKAWPDIWTETGQFSKGRTRGELDLVPVTVGRTVWLNIYPSNGMASHASRRDADEQASIGRVACVKVTFREGQFDE